MVANKKQAESNTGNNNGGHHTDQENFYDAWRDYYQRMSEDGLAFFQKSVEVAQEFNPYYPGSEAMKRWMEQYEGVTQKMGEGTPSNFMDMDAFKNMYDLWLSTMTDNMQTWMRTPEFVAQNGSDLETFSEMRKRMSDAWEAYWEAIHLPSTRDVREVYRKLYNIERKLDEMDRRFRDGEAAQKSSASAKK